MRTATACAPLCAIVLAALGGCGGDPPSLTVADAYIAQSSADSTLLHVVIDATNPSSEPLAMRAVAYEAAAGAGQTQRWTRASVPPNGSVRFELPVVVAGQAGSTVNVAGKVDYVPTGRFRDLLGELDVPLPSTNFGGSVPVAAQRTTPVQVGRPGQVFTATMPEPRPLKAVDTLTPPAPK